MSSALGGRVLDHQELVSFARQEPYAQAVVFSAMNIGMILSVPVVALPFAYAMTAPADHDVIGALLTLPVTVLDPLTPEDTPELGRILADVNPALLGPDALALAAAANCARRRGWPVVTGNAAALRSLDPGLTIDELP